MTPLVEVVACTPDDALHAQNAGAGRVELVSAISEGGLTPSVGAMIETKAHCAIPAVAMIRPRSGGFLYTDLEFRTMLRDIEALAEAGANGFVLGMLTPTGELDTDRLRTVVEAAQGIPLVFHRAFDLLAEPFDSLERLIDLGFARILTSGLAGDAHAGLENLVRLAERGADRIEIMPGGGVRANNVAAIFEATRVGQVHLGPFRPAIDFWSGDAPDRTLAQHDTLDPDQVRAVVAALQETGSLAE